MSGLKFIHVSKCPTEDQVMRTRSWTICSGWCSSQTHDDVIKWKHFLRYRPFVRGSHRSPVNSPHKGRWRWALIFSLICAWINGWVNNGEAGDFRRHRANYDLNVMFARIHTMSVNTCAAWGLLICFAAVRSSPWTPWWKVSNKGRSHPLPQNGLSGCTPTRCKHPILFLNHFLKVY